MTWSSPTAHVVCSSCSGEHDITLETSINVSHRPELKARALSGELFTWRCPHCGASNLAHFPLLYHDPDQRLIMLLSDAPVSVEGLDEGYTGRLVRTPGDFVEKLKIFDSSLDDVVVELCKLVTCREMGRDLDLRFFRLDGADSQMLFTYPQDGEMQMLAVGLNVYEDCSAIAARNPSLKPSRGLAVVDGDWLFQFIG